MNPTNEPIYYVTTRFSGVGFADPARGLAVIGDKVHAVIVPAEQVDPEIREQGRAWLAVERS